MATDDDNVAIGARNELGFEELRVAATQKRSLHLI
jgi:hypothetical protein